MQPQSVTQIRIAGFGGQGVVLAGTLLGHAAVRQGLWVAGSNAYGAQARGGAARSEVVVSFGPIAFPHVIRADILVAMSQAGYDAFIAHTAESGAQVIYDSALVTRRSVEGVRQTGIPATDTAVSELENKQVANIVMLGALAALTGVVGNEALETVARDQVPARFVESNLRALARGFELGEKERPRGGREKV